MKEKTKKPKTTYTTYFQFILKTRVSGVSVHSKSLWGKASIFLQKTLFLFYRTCFTWNIFFVKASGKLNTKSLYRNLIFLILSLLIILSTIFDVLITPCREDNPRVSTIICFIQKLRYIKFFFVTFKLSYNMLIFLPSVFI